MDSNKKVIMALAQAYNLNLLTTKTNIFVSISSFLKGKTIILKSSKHLGYSGPKKRLLTTGQHLIRDVLNIFFEDLSGNEALNGIKPRFLINLRGINYNYIQVRLVKYIIKLFKKKFNIIAVIVKENMPHNGCPLQIRKRKKNKGANKSTKRNKWVSSAWRTSKSMKLRKRLWQRRHLLLVKKTYSGNLSLTRRLKVSSTVIKQRSARLGYKLQILRHRTFLSALYRFRRRQFRKTKSIFFLKKLKVMYRRRRRKYRLSLKSYKKRFRFKKIKKQQKNRRFIHIGRKLLKIRRKRVFKLKRNTKVKVLKRSNKPA